MTHARAALVAQRESAVARIAALSESLGSVLAAADSVATDDEHDPEGVTIAVERAQLNGLIDAARARIAEIDAALRRLDNGGYGQCSTCGHPIGAERLAARPATITCIGCAPR